MTQRTNDVTLFSNGIGHFRRIYKVRSGDAENISIPFKRDHIGDVAASLQVFGPVRLNTPPSFTPMNANATALKIDQDDAMKSLLRNLSGAEVKVKYTNDTVETATLLGIDVDENYKNDIQIDDCSVVLMHGGSVKRRRLAEVEDIHFNDEGVRTEIVKALKNNFQRIKPDSTLLDLSVAALGDETEAVVQYTIPVAAWKMRYAIREDKGRFSLEGAAIIDNNTDEDWDNFRVSVVTGNPISFNTNIASVVVPNRKFVSLVDADTQGNVYVEQGITQNYGGASPSPAPARMMACSATRGGMTKSSVSNYASFGFESLHQSASGDANLESYYSQELAETAGVDSREVGDFCVFTSKEPITILARKSAVVPMFTVPLNKAGIVLYYREDINARRPCRTVKFKNETEYSLGRGKTVIYNEGIFSGECVLEATKPGENRMLPHCVENSVRVIKEQKGIDNRRSSIKIGEGSAVYEDVSTAVTTYTLENKKDELAKMAVEHVTVLSKASGFTNTLTDFDGVEVKEREKLTATEGTRVYFELAPKQTLTLTVTETAVNKQSVHLDYTTFTWFRTNLVSTGHELSNDKSVVKAIALQAEIDEINAELSEATRRRKELTDQAGRTRENLVAAKDVSNSTTIAEWVRDLDVTEKEVRKIDTDLVPKLNKKRSDTQKRLTDALREATVSWKS